MLRLPGGTNVGCVGGCFKGECCWLPKNEIKCKFCHKNATRKLNIGRPPHMMDILKSKSISNR